MKNQISIYISGPDDVNNEKEIIKKVVKSLNSIYADTEHYSFNILNTKNNYTHSTSEYDIFIGILWKTFETTKTLKIEEEFENALKTNSKCMFYFSNIPISPDEIDTIEFGKILKFKEEIIHEELYYEYNSLNAFEDLIYNNLRILATEKKDKEIDPIDSTVKEQKGIFDLMEEFISNFESAEKDIKNLTNLFESMDKKTKQIPEPAGEDIKSFIIYSDSMAELFNEFSDEFEINKKYLSNHLSEGINAFIELIGPYGKYIEEKEIDEMINSINGCITGIDEFNEQMIGVSEIFEALPPITNQFNKSKQRFVRNLKGLVKDLQNFKGMLHTSLEELK